MAGRYNFDATLEINRGVLADEIVATHHGVTVWRVSYQDPETGIIYRYLTTLPATIPPGIIALL